MDFSKLSEPLTIDKIEFRLKTINKGGYALILAYKDARADMDRLDEVCGPGMWTRRHTRDNRNCVVSIYNHEIDQWIDKEDTGTESNTEAEKGLASDSFKRACFNWGIGRELYDYPVIKVKLEPKEFQIQGDRARQTWDFKLNEWKWYSEFEGKKISFLAAKDNLGKVRFKWGEKKK